MSIAKSISVEELTKGAERAAETVLAGRLKALGGKAEIGIFPDIGTIGIILRDWQFERAQVGEMFEMSVKMTEAMGELARGGQPVFRVVKGGATMGYFPVAPVLLRELR